MQDYSQAAYWYKKAAEQGNANAKAALEKVLGKEKMAVPYQVQSQPAQAHQVTPSSTNGANDMFQRANDLYNQGRYAEALPLYQQLARYSGAQIRLGGMYESGNGVTKDYNQAIYWYRKAAEQGDENEKMQGLR